MGRKTKYSFLAFSLLAIVLLGIVAFNFFSHRNKSQLIIRVSPSDSAIQINDRAIKPGKYYLPPGIYKIQASRSGFLSDTQTVQVELGKPANVFLLPVPNSEEAKDYLKNNPKEQSQREVVGGEKFNTEQDNLRASYPILAKLPFELRYASIGYGQSVKYPSDTAKIAITIKAGTEVGRRQGIAYIRDQGYDPTDYEITFIGFNNPFIYGLGE